MQRASTSAPKTTAAAPSGWLGARRFGVIQRKCGCEGPGAAFGECERCKAQRGAPLQRRGMAPSGDGAAEREADRIADQVMDAAAPRALPQSRAVGEAAPMPSLFGDVLGSPGEPLDAMTRAYMEPRFGRDFSGVRVHADAQAAASARAIDALAYASGPHIAFGARQYQPATHEGRQLIAHELAHVVQQRASGAALQRKPATLSYGRTGFNISLPKQPFTLQDAKDFVTQRTREKPPALTSGNAVGAPPGSDAEIFLWYVLASVAKPDLWGTENDLIVPIGWPPAAPASQPGPAPGTTPPATAPGSAQGTTPAPAAQPAPTAAVTIRIDDKGAGVATLISSGPVAAPKTYADVGAAQQGLIAAYHLKSVVDGDASWTAEELNIVAGAFALVPDKDKGVLQDVDLKRVAVIDATHAAQFSLETAAVDETTTAASQTKTLSVGNATFASADKLFVGGGQTPAQPRAYQTIVHEVGHAVASKAVAVADLASAKATIAANQAITKSNEAIDATNNELPALNALIDEYNAIVVKLNATQNATDRATLESERKAKKAEVDAKQKEVDQLKKDQDAAKAAATTAKDAATKAKAGAAATRVPASAVQAGMTNVKNLRATAGTALKAAQASAGGFATADADASKSYRDAVEAVSKELTDYTTEVEAGTADPDSRDDSVKTAMATRDSEKDSLTKAAAGNPALAAFAPVETAQLTWANALKTQSRLPQRTLRVQHFVDMINANKIVPFTPYAKENWPHNPEEFFAEAYSLWRTDKDYLKLNSEPVFNWFEAGHHRD